MREAEVVAAFCGWLEQDGWSVQREVEHVDVVAEREGIRLYAEAKGETKAIGLDVDTMYGQILRRMPIGEDPAARLPWWCPSGRFGLRCVSGRVSVSCCGSRSTASTGRAASGDISRRRWSSTAASRARSARALKPAQWRSGSSRRLRGWSPRR